MCKSGFVKSPQLIKCAIPQEMLFVQVTCVTSWHTEKLLVQSSSCWGVSKVSFTVPLEKIACWSLNLGWEINKWILKGFLGAGLYRIVTELIHMVSFAVCFTFFGCCDSHVLFFKAVALQSVRQNWAYNKDAELGCSTPFFYKLMFFWLFSALCRCFMDFHIISFWPVKTTTCQDRSLHQQQYFCM